VNEPTHLDLFSGIGGFALAAKWNGYRTVAFCDNEPYAQAVLKKHWPDVPIHKDIREVRGKLYAGVTLLTGGFPCQPFSVAGKQRGKDDDRYLWPEMLRVIREARPAWIIGENVAGIVNMALDQVCADLEAEGYEIEPLIIPACGVDAPHKRDRVWIIAHVGNTQPDGCVASKKRGGSGEESVSGRPSQPQGQKEIAERQLAGTSGASADVANAISVSEGGAHGSKKRECERGWEESNISQRNEVGSNIADGGEDVANTASGESGQQAKRQGREDIGRRGKDCGGAENEGTEALPDPNGAGRQERSGQEREGIQRAYALDREGRAVWLSEPDVGRVAHGIPNRVHRLKGLGNAIVPQVAAEIIRCIRRVSLVEQPTTGDQE